MTKVKIRGIYATALTKLLSELGYEIVQPSFEISKRLKIPQKYDAPDVQIFDKKDKHGIIVTGDFSSVNELIRGLREVLPDLTILSMSPSLNNVFELNYDVILGYASYEVEFPYTAKLRLDIIRQSVVSTIRGHHIYRAFVNKEVLDNFERALCTLPNQRAEIERAAEKLFTLSRLKTGLSVEIEHIKPGVGTIKLTPGEIIKCDSKSRVITLRRNFHSNGVYDGLGIKKEKGDYAITEIRKGAPFIKHSYYSADGVLKGQLYNINTPVEFYADRVRYVDLFLDVVRFPNGVIKVIDKRELNDALQSEYITGWMANFARKVTERLYKRLTASRHHIVSKS